MENIRRLGEGWSLKFVVNLGEGWNLRLEDSYGGISVNLYRGNTPMWGGNAWGILSGPCKGLPEDGLRKLSHLQEEIEKIKFLDPSNWRREAPVAVLDKAKDALAKEYTDFVLSCYNVSSVEELETLVAAKNAALEAAEKNAQEQWEHGIELVPGLIFRHKAIVYNGEVKSRKHGFEWQGEPLKTGSIFYGSIKDAAEASNTTIEELFNSLYDKLDPAIIIGHIDMPLNGLETAKGAIKWYYNFMARVNSNAWADDCHLSATSRARRED